MQPTIKILEKIKINSSKNKNEIFTRLYRYLLRPDIYYLAYKNLYANNGAATKGVNDDTADGFSESKIADIISKLADGSYKPKPSRRVYIEKSNGKKRPLGIPVFRDKIIQEVLRMILEAVYEPTFSIYSYGFRPNKGCHTALNVIKTKFHGTKWFVEGDIKGCFDNINHSVLMNLLNTKIKDVKLMQLINKFLKAGYFENWKFNKTYSGTPQGGIISPILANIYLHEIDKYIEKLKTEFDKPSEAVYGLTPEYRRKSCRLKKVRRRIGITKSTEKREQLLQELATLKTEIIKLPAKSPTDKVLKYVRYADDFIIGVNGTKEDCEKIKSKLKAFISSVLKMELSDEKTLITHSSKYARFLGYDIRVRRNGLKRRDKNGVAKRSLSNTAELTVPLKDKIEKFLLNIKTVKVDNGTLKPAVRKALLRLTDLEIIATFNAELRGICNYYSLASNYVSLNYFAYLMEYSCLKTLAAKYGGSTHKMFRKYSDGKGNWCIPYETKTGKKTMYFADWKECKKNSANNDIKTVVSLMHLNAPTTFEARLKAKECELCGDKNAKQYEIHHINKVKNFKGKQH